MSKSPDGVTENTIEEESKFNVSVNDLKKRFEESLVTTKGTTMGLLESIKNEYILVYGCTGHGKSSFINYFLDKNCIRCERAATSAGKDPCTVKPAAYFIDNMKLTLLDTMGTHDPKVKNESGVNMTLIDFLLDYKVKINHFKAIIYIHQIGEIRAAHIDTYLKNLSEALKTTINPENVIVLLTKAGEMKEKVVKDKVGNFKKESSNYPQVIPWDSMKDDEIDDQYEQLLKAISECKPTNIGFMDEMEKKINSKAKELWENDTMPFYYVIEHGIKKEVNPHYTKTHYEYNEYKVDENVHYVENISDWCPISGLLALPVESIMNGTISFFNAIFGTEADDKLGIISDVCRKIIPLKLSRDFDYDYKKKSEQLLVKIKGTNGCTVEYAVAEREGESISFKFKLEYPKKRLGFKNSADFKIFGTIIGRKTVVEHPSLITEYHRRYSKIQEKHYKEAIVILGNTEFDHYRKQHWAEIAKLVETHVNSKSA